VRRVPVTIPHAQQGSGRDHPDRAARRHQVGPVLLRQAAQLAVVTRDSQPVTKLDLNNASAHVVTVPNAIHAFVAHRLDGGSNDISVAFTA